jgi:hypothetical protein
MPNTVATLLKELVQKIAERGALPEPEGETKGPDYYFG